jgi:hypothetical protein
MRALRALPGELHHHSVLPDRQGLEREGVVERPVYLGRLERFLRNAEIRA